MEVDWQLYHWHLELSSKCTLKCPRCPRIEHPDTPWINKDITYDQFTSSFTEEFITANVKRFTLCGDVGDPIYNKEFIEIIRYIKDIKPDCHIFIITNGSYKKPVWWKELATVLNEYDSINFSVDGYDQASNNLYRINSDFESIMTGMNILGHESNCFVNWAAIYFSFNEHHLDDIRNLAKQNGCDAIQWTKSTKFGSKYGDAYNGDEDLFEPSEEYISSTHRYERHMEYLTERRPLNSEYLSLNTKLYHNIKQQYDTHIVPLCLVGNRGMYISGDGTVHPCSWVSFPYNSMSANGKTINYKDSFFPKHRHELSIKSRPLNDILEDPIWKTITSKWNRPSCSWVECDLKCAKEYIDFDYAVGYETN